MIWIGRDPKDQLVQSPPATGRDISQNKVTQGATQPGLERLQEETSPTSLNRLFLCHHHSEEFLPYI